MPAKSGDRHAFSPNGRGKSESVPVFRFFFDLFIGGFNYHSLRYRHIYQMNRYAGITAASVNGTDILANCRNVR